MARTVYQDEPKRDEATGIMMDINYAQHKIYAGDSFVASMTADVSSAGSKGMFIKTPNTNKWCHLFITALTESESQFDLIENPIITGSTVAMRYNRNRNSATISSASVYTAPVFSSGIVISTQHWGTRNLVGDENHDTLGFILKRNEDYVIRIINSTTSKNFIAIRLDWYEHTNLS